MPKKAWGPLEEQMKMTFVYEGETPVKIPYPGGDYLVKPGVEMQFPEQIGIKLVGRKGFKLIGESKAPEEDKPKKVKKTKKAELEDEKPEESTEEIKEESD